VKSLGAAKAINYKTENFADEINKITNGQGVNVILDMIGGDYTPNIQSLAEEGRLVIINMMKGKDVQVDLSAVMRKRLTITGSMLRSRDTLFKAPSPKISKKHIWPLLASGKIKPVINAVFPAEKAADAHQVDGKQGAYREDCY
jgi:NADPH2:quinone reductase